MNGNPSSELPGGGEMPPPVPARPPAARRIAYWVFAVALPAATLAFEAVSGFCAAILFDPMPTALHALLVALVPAAHALGLATLSAPAPSRGRRRLALAANAAALAVSGWYALRFLPFTPLAVLGVLYVGGGLLPLSPAIALGCGIGLRCRLRRAAPAGARAPAALAVAAALLVLVGFEVPGWVTHVGLRAAASERADVRARGLRVLRAAGSERELLRACYENRSREFDLFDLALSALSGTPPALEDRRAVYYRVTGTPYNAVPPPRLAGRRGVFLDPDAFDFDRGGDAVGGRIKGLSLHESRLDGRVEAASGSAYWEWTLVFRNASAAQQEARAEIVLPPGAVVSRLTLWVDGEEREAAFHARRRVKEAYQRIVQRRRDPVLVTTAGPDRVRLQCFPVPPDGGTMKTRIGITVPFALDEQGDGRVPLPCLADRNFGVPDDRTTSAWAEGDTPLSAADGGAAWSAAAAPPGRHALRAALPADALRDGGHLRARRPDGGYAGWARDDRSAPPGIVRVGELMDADPAPPLVVVVVDGSRRMQPHLGAVADFLAAIPAAAKPVVLLAADEVERVGDFAVLRRRRLAGGSDNLPALTEALELAGGTPGAVVFWIHAAQPALLSAVEPLRQRLAWRPDGPGIRTYAVEPAVNRIAEEIGDHPAWKPVPRLGGPAADLAEQAARWAGRPVRRIERERMPPDAAVAGLPEVSQHAIRLWAAGEIDRLRRVRGAAAEEAALRLAMAWQLVTPVSGAVVLESAEQFREAGLTPVDAATAPEAVPEPGTWALLAAGVAALGARRWWQRRRRA